MTLGRDLPSRPSPGLPPRRTVWTGPRPATTKRPLPGLPPPTWRLPTRPAAARTHRSNTAPPTAVPSTDSGRR